MLLEGHFQQVPWKYLSGRLKNDDLIDTNYNIIYHILYYSFGFLRVLWKSNVWNILNSDALIRLDLI